jgi:hypothetical protein
MPSQDIIVIDHRTRCKFCGDYAAYYTNTIGLSYTGYYNPRGSNRALQDLSSYSQRDDKEYDYDKLLRENSIRGVCNASSYIFKIHKESWGSYRVLVSCKCGQSTWMFPGPSSDPLPNNRKLKGNFYKYPERVWLANTNVRW